MPHVYARIIREAHRWDIKRRGSCYDVATLPPIPRDMLVLDSLQIHMNPPQSPNYMLTSSPNQPQIFPTRHAKGAAQGSIEATLDQWFENFRKHEALLEAMAAASADAKFKEELTIIEQWFTILSEAEQTASIYTLLQHSNPVQIRFFIAVLQQMIRTESGSAPPTPYVETSRKSGHGPRPPHLNLSLPQTPRSPALIHFNTPVAENGDHVVAIPVLVDGVPVDLPTSPAQYADDKPKRRSWASMTNTPLDMIFEHPTTITAPTKAWGLGSRLPNPEASTTGTRAETDTVKSGELLTVEMIMEKLIQSATPATLPRQQIQPTTLPRSKTPDNWRGARNTSPNPNPRSTTKNGRSTNQSNGGKKSRTGEPAIDSLLNNVPAWLKSLRLHKYTANFEGVTWREMVVMDDETLEARGVVVIGARRRLLRTFEEVRQKMGISGGGENKVQ
ncbi:hypothetical protein BD779DRAFT_962995 [Infundibulicybe gibba]|nr:hypothetical protein BD779DRAFT_962995 [Infundibulicybe gibba]